MRRHTYVRHTDTLFEVQQYTAQQWLLFLQLCVSCVCPLKNITMTPLGTPHLFLPVDRCASYASNTASSGAETHDIIAKGDYYDTVLIFC